MTERWEIAYNTAAYLRGKAERHGTSYDYEVHELACKIDEYMTARASQYVDTLFAGSNYWRADGTCLPNDLTHALFCLGWREVSETFNRKPWARDKEYMKIIISAYDWDSHYGTSSYSRPYSRLVKKI